VPFVQTGVYYPRLYVYMPYYDHTLKTTRYVQANSHYVQDSVAGTTDLELRLLQLAFLNNVNPDWKLVTQGAPVLYPNVEGHLEIFQNKATSVNVIVIKEGPNIDKWWGTPDIGKYGVVRQKRDDMDLLPLCFLNTDNCFYQWEETDTTGVVIDLQPGVQADVFVQSAPGDDTNQSQIPPVYYYTQTGVQWAQVPMSQADAAGMSYAPLTIP